MRIIALAMLALASTGCNRAPPASADQRRAALNQIADKCGLPRSTFRLVDNNQLRMRPSADAKYESVDCALTELKKNKSVGDLPMGFVGNEYYSNEVE